MVAQVRRGTNSRNTGKREGRGAGERGMQRKRFRKKVPCNGQEAACFFCFRQTGGVWLGIDCISQNEIVYYTSDTLQHKCPEVPHTCIHTCIGTSTIDPTRPAHVHLYLYLCSTSIPTASLRCPYKCIILQLRYYRLLPIKVLVTFRQVSCRQAVRNTKYHIYRGTSRSVQSV